MARFVYISLGAKPPPQSAAVSCGVTATELFTFLKRLPRLPRPQGSQAVPRRSESLGEGREEATGALARREGGGSGQRAAPGLQFMTPLFHRKMEHSALSAHRGEVGGTLRSSLGDATRAQPPESGTRGAALRESLPLESRPLVDGRPLDQCLGAKGLSGANQRLGPGWGRGAKGAGGGRSWVGLGSAPPRRGTGAARYLCGEGYASVPEPGRAAKRPAEPRWAAPVQLNRGPCLPGRRLWPSLAPRGSCAVETRRVEAARPEVRRGRVLGRVAGGRGLVFADGVFGTRGDLPSSWEQRPELVSPAWKSPHSFPSRLPHLWILLPQLCHLDYLSPEYKPHPRARTHPSYARPAERPSRTNSPFCYQIPRFSQSPLHLLWNSVRSALVFILEVDFPSPKPFFHLEIVTFQHCWKFTMLVNIINVSFLLLISSINNYHS